MLEGIAYEVGVDEPVHPDSAIEQDFTEVGTSDCAHGCTIYRSNRNPKIAVLAHYGAYGCQRTKADILAGKPYETV